MNILIIGSGGREHAFAWKIKLSPLCEHLYIAPGNAGTAQLGTNLNIAVNDFESIATAALLHQITLVLVGPEAPLVDGIVDYFLNTPCIAHIKIIGPSKAAAQLEGSKAFSKAFMQRHGVPTAAYKEFTANNFNEGISYLKNHSLPIVLKADGLAAGKGVLICNSVAEAKAEFELMLLQSKFGEASNKVVVEEFLQGIEMSVFVLTDGKNYVMLPEAKDYKRIGEGDTGLNTGGMGAVSPVPFMNEVLKKNIIQTIIEPTIAGLQIDNLPYKGFIFIGLMVQNNEAIVIEYNCRMGDPETEVVIPRIENDFVVILLATTNQTLNSTSLHTSSQTAVATVAVSGGYPGHFVKGFAIEGINAKNDKSSLLFQAGTLQSDNAVITNGGRVLVSVGFGDNIADAQKNSEAQLSKIHFEGISYRRDIGYEFM